MQTFETSRKSLLALSPRRNSACPQWFASGPKTDAAIRKAAVPAAASATAASQTKPGIDSDPSSDVGVT